MKCFVHLEEEAIAVCRQCGKGMCADCSAYSAHSGICPACRKEVLKAEAAKKRIEIEALKSEIVRNVIVAVLLCWTVIAIFIGIYQYKTKTEKVGQLERRVRVLRTEIRKIEAVLAHRGGKSFT